jgi:hypothetical protein
LDEDHSGLCGQIDDSKRVTLDGFQSQVSPVATSAASSDDASFLLPEPGIKISASPFGELCSDSSSEISRGQKAELAMPKMSAEASPRPEYGRMEEPAFVEENCGAAVDLDR